MTQLSNRPRYIYGLADADGRVRYVGKTTDVRSRLGSHLDRARHGTTPLYAWLRELAEPPAAVVLAEVPAHEANRAEREWILRLRAEADPDAPLFNVRPYVDGWPKLTEEHKAKIGAANRGRVITAEARARQAATMRGRRLSAAHRQAIRDGHLGHPKSEAHRAAIAAALRSYNETVPREPVPCSGCGREFRGAQGLSVHRGMATDSACRGAEASMGVAA